MRSTSMKIIAVLAGISLTVYYFVRVYFFHISIGTPDGFFAISLLLAETYMILHAFGFVHNIFRLQTAHEQDKYPLHPAQYPSVAVIVAARHEPSEVLEQTFIALSGLKYPNKKLYFLEGSSDPEFLARDAALVKKYGLTLFNRRRTHGAKAGIVNDFLDTIKEEFVVIFDADQNPMPDFLQRVVAIALEDEKIAFVQTPQFYSNIEVSPIAKGAGMQQSIFYESICEAKGTENAMFCCGTNVLFRRSALVAVGGFDEDSITEDFATSIKLHVRGYRSVYFNHVRAFGMAPESLPAYFKQQARWAAGTAHAIRTLIAIALTKPWSLSLVQWWEYFLSSTYYFIGWAFFLLMISPIAFLIAGIPSYFLSPWVYVPTFIPYFTMTAAVFYATMRKRHYTGANVYTGIILGSLSFPILMIATLKGLLVKKLTFQVTPKGLSDKVSIIFLWPWLSMIVLNVVALYMGFLKFSINPYAIGINMFWCGYHLFVLFHIFILNTRPQLSDKAVYEPYV